MKTINIEIAEGPSMLAQGLMYRETLASDNGMLFKFPDITYASFWGKNTYIPLDIAFITHNGEVAEISDINHIAPMSTKSIHSTVPCKYALEVNAGFFKENDIGIGTKIEIDEKNKKINWRKENV